MAWKPFDQIKSRHEARMQNYPNMLTRTGPVFLGQAMFTPKRVWLVVWRHGLLEAAALLPVFALILFRHKSAFIVTGRSIEKPQALRGKIICHGELAFDLADLVTRHLAV